jgi:hypothetical protein
VVLIPEFVKAVKQKSLAKFVRKWWVQRLDKLEEDLILDIRRINDAA